MDAEPAPETPALRALADSGLAHEVTRHGRVGSLAEAAAARGVQPRDVVKTLVVRRAEDDFLFVLVPGTNTVEFQCFSDQAPICKKPNFMALITGITF